MAFLRILFCLILVSVHFRTYCTFSGYLALDTDITPNFNNPSETYNFSCNVDKELVNKTKLTCYKKEGTEYFAKVKNHTKANTIINVNRTKYVQKIILLCELWCKKRTAKNYRYGLISNETELAVKDGNSSKDNNYLVVTMGRNNTFTVSCEANKTLNAVSYIEMYRIKGNLIKVLTVKEFNNCSSSPCSVEYTLTNCEKNSKIFCRLFNDSDSQYYYRSNDIDIQLISNSVFEEDCDEDSCFSSSVKSDARTSFPVIWTVTSLIILIMIVIMAIFYSYYRRKRTKSPPVLRTENAGHANDEVLYAEIQVNQSTKNTTIPERTQYATIVGILKPRN